METESELQIHLDRTGTFWATILHKTELLAFDEEKNDLSVCALDPGTRTFNTVYNNQGIVTEVAPGDVGRIYRLCRHTDRLQSKLNQPGVRLKQRCKMHKAWFKIFNRIRNLVKDVHRKGVKYLCENFDMGFVPDFNTGRMVRKNRGYRQIRSKIAHAMLTWSHFSFKVLLKAKAAKMGMAIVRLMEEYTSKACTACGSVHHKFGSAKAFNCPSCGFTTGRDVNGARNILLKSMHELGPQVSAHQ